MGTIYNLLSHICRIFCPPYSVHSVVPNLSQYFHSSSKQKRHHYREEYIPPALRPVLTHMNDPSHFLPSSKFYSVPPYTHTVDRERSIDDTIEPQSVKNASDDDVTGGEKNRFGSGLESCTSHCSGKLTDMYTNSSPQLPRHLQHPSQPHFTQAHTQRTRANLSHSNGDVTSGSNKDHFRHLTQSSSMTSPIVGVSDHTPSTSTCDEQSLLFEVGSDTMKLSIAREEEVTSSLFEDMASYFDPSSEIENVF